MDISAKANAPLLLEEDLTKGTVMSVVLEALLPLSASLRDPSKTLVALMPMYVHDTVSGVQGCASVLVYEDFP